MDVRSRMKWERTRIWAAGAQGAAHNEAWRSGLRSLGGGCPYSPRLGVGRVVHRPGRREWVPKNSSETAGDSEQPGGHAAPRVAASEASCGSRGEFRRGSVPMVLESDQSQELTSGSPVSIIPASCRSYHCSNSECGLANPSFGMTKAMSFTGWTLAILQKSGGLTKPEGPPTAFRTMV